PTTLLAAKAEGGEMALAKFTLKVVLPWIRSVTAPYVVMSSFTGPTPKVSPVRSVSSGAPSTDETDNNSAKAPAAARQQQLLDMDRLSIGWNAQSVKITATRPW